MRFINMDKCKVQLASEQEEAKGAIDSLDEETLKKLDPEKSFGKEAADDEELKQIRDNEKTVNIRFGNYSMIMRASQYGISSKLLGLLSGNMGKSKDGLDASEGKVVSEEKADKGYEWD